MAIEIERKFLVKPHAWVPRDPGVRFQQGYLSSVKERVVRVRTQGGEARLTIKGITSGVARAEFEYPIPLVDAQFLLEHVCERPLIEKHRHVEFHGGRKWEIDVFHGDNDGLVVAEVEVPSEDAEIALPAWAGPEVSHDPRFFNSNLAQRPFRSWAADSIR
jgi:adenylate cyclase